MVWLSGARISPAAPGVRSAMSSRREASPRQSLADCSGVLFLYW